MGWCDEERESDRRREVATTRTTGDVVAAQSLHGHLGQWFTTCSLKERLHNAKYVLDSSMTIRGR
jgi:hypothetical protein